MSCNFDPYVPYDPAKDMVDLGLSFLIAKGNLGATNGDTKESWYGNYYAWGEVETKSDYSWATYLRHSDGQFNSGSHKNSFKKYIPSDKTQFVAEGYTTDNKLVLDAVDDIVTATYGSGYVMPTIDDIKELIDETDKEWVTDYNGITGLNGRKFMKKSDHSVFIFIPAASLLNGSSVLDAGVSGNVWSSSLSPASPNNARYLLFDSNDVVTYYLNRYYGVSVRAIQPKP